MVDSKIILRVHRIYPYDNQAIGDANTISLERRCSSRTFRYGYLVTT